MRAGVDAFVIFENRILLILRDDIAGIQNPNKWNLPGGGIEERENEHQAMVRELKEEIGIEPQNLRMLDKTHYDDGNIVTKFWVQLDRGEVSQLKLGEGQKMEFFAYEALFDLDVIPNLRSYLNNHGNELRERLNNK